MNHDAKAYLGTGWSFPPVFDADRGSVETVSGVADVQRGLALLFSTEPGERPMLPGLGCALRQFQFEGLTQSLLTQITDEIETSISRFEPRVEGVAVEVSENETNSGQLDVEVAYRIRGTNSRYNVVFPYYLTEGATTSLYFDA